jgi:putative hemolysin
MGTQAVLAHVGGLGVRQADWLSARASLASLRRACFFGRADVAAPGALASGSPGEDDPLDRRARHIIAEASDGPAGATRIVGACRLYVIETPSDLLAAACSEAYCVETLAARHPALRLAELGRFCLAPSARGRAGLEALWRALWLVLRAERIDAIFGAASLPVADFGRHQEALGYLCDIRRGDPQWRVAARDPARARRFPASQGRPRLPALLRGYLELGATFSPEATLDGAFDTTDVFVAQPVAALNRRYVAYFS